MSNVSDLTNNNASASIPDNASIIIPEEIENKRKEKENNVRKTIQLEASLPELPVKEDLSPLDVDKDSYVYENPLNFRETNWLMNNFDIPKWGIKNYINERGAFQKQLGTILGDPAWFYFKIFFKFDTNFGLFGGVLDSYDASDESFANTINCAKRYFYNIKNRYKQEIIEKRLESLLKFVRTLSFISCNAPWVFQSVKDLDNSLKYDLSKSPESKSIYIDLLQDAIDMRLSSLFDLYRFAAFDFAHDKEILPENLRKFDMDIVLFQVPIKYLQTSIKDMRNNAVPYKNLYDNTDMSNRMSFHLFTLQNCEFDINSFSSLIPGTISNEKPFELKPTIKINYDKCYHHSLNEFIHVLVGDSGFENFSYNTDSEKTRNTILKYAYDHPYTTNYASNNYKAMVEASEDILGNAMRVVSPTYALGNLYRESDWSDLYNAPWDAMKNTWGNFKDAFTNPVKNLFPSGTTKYHGYEWRNR